MAQQKASFPEFGFVRLPKPVKLGPRTTAWRVEDIRELIERLGNGDDNVR